MRILRYLLGALIGAYALFSLFPIATDAAFKLGMFDNPTGEVARMIPLWQATAWWHLALWLVVVALFLVAAWRLLRGRRATAPYAAAFILDMALWATMKTLPAYGQVFTPAELELDNYTLAFMVACGVLIWLSERRRAQPAPA